MAERLGRIGAHLLRLYPLLVVAAAYEALSRSGLVSARLLPNLEQIGTQLWRFTLNGVLPYHASITLERALAGFAAAIVVGILIGTVMARVRWFDALFEPIFSFGYPIPKISFYPIFILVFGLGDMSKIALVFLECLYPITIQTYFGMRGAERVLVWAARNMGAGPSALFWRVLVPSAAPAIFSGIRIALPLALIVTLITEIIGESRGLGYFVTYQSASYEYARAMAAFLVIGLIGFAFDRLLVLLRRRLIHWQGESDAFSVGADRA